MRYDGADADVLDLELSDSPDPALYRFGKLTSLLAWNRQYPVTSAERERNQRVYSDCRHNRNQFIDQAEYAEAVSGCWEDGLALLRP